MLIITVLVSVALVISIGFNIKPRKSKKPVLATDARQLLHDLSHGGAIVKVTVIDPEGLLIYRGGA